MSDMGVNGSSAIPKGVVEEKLNQLRASLEMAKQQRQSHQAEAKRLETQIFAHEGAIQVLESLIAAPVGDVEDQE